MIDEETEPIVEESKARALYALRANWVTAQETATTLEHETLSGVALDAVLSTVERFEIDGIPLPEHGTHES